MGRRSERLSKQAMLASDLAGEGDVIQVVSRAFDVLRCFEGHDARLGNLEIPTAAIAAIDGFAADAHADPGWASWFTCRRTRNTVSVRARSR